MKEAGGVFVIFVGVVLLIGGFNGTLKKTWNALTGTLDSPTVNPNPPVIDVNNPPAGGVVPVPGSVGIAPNGLNPSPLLVPPVHPPGSISIIPQVNWPGSGVATS